MQPLIYKADDLKIEIRHDPHNWIVMFGNPNLKHFEKHAEYWYFSALEMMLQRLFTLLRDHGIKSLDLRGISRANALAAKTITQIASDLEDHLADSNEENKNEKTYNSN